DGLLTLTVDAGGVTESMQRRIPIALPAMDLGVFPEGGDLVAGLESRVYLAGKDKLGSPVEFEGDIVDDKGAAVAHTNSFYGGMARVAFTPAAGAHYRFKAQKPRGADVTATFPDAKSSGCVMQSEDDFTSTTPEVRVKVSCTSATKLLATAVLRERMIGSA